MEPLLQLSTQVSNEKVDDFKSCIFELEENLRDPDIFYSKDEEVIRLRQETEEHLFSLQKSFKRYLQIKEEVESELRLALLMNFHQNLVKKVISRRINSFY